MRVLYEIRAANTRCIGIANVTLYEKPDGRWHERGRYLKAIKTFRASGKGTGSEVEK